MLKKFFKIRKEIKEARKTINSRGYDYVTREVRNVLYNRGYMVATTPENNGLYLVRANCGKNYKSIRWLCTHECRRVQSLEKSEINNISRSLKALTEKSASAFYSAIEHGNTRKFCKESGGNKNAENK